MPIISNSSPLILFAKIGHLDLLQRLFGDVFAPPAVYEEVVIHGSSRLESRDVAAAADSKGTVYVLGVTLDDHHVWTYTAGAATPTWQILGSEQVDHIQAFDNTKDRPEVVISLF